MIKRLVNNLRTEEIASFWLAFFRFNIALLVLLHFLSIQPDFDALFSFRGYIYPDILDAEYDHHSLTLYSLYNILHGIHINVSYDSLLTVCRIAYPAFLLMLILGCLTRLAAIASLFFQLLFIKSIHLYEYGVDYYTTIALFYCCIFPVGKVLSLDNYFFKRRSAAPDSRIYLNVLKIHLCIAYFFSGYDKVIGDSWRSGEALWKSLHAHSYYGLFSLDFLASTPFFFLGCWATVILEMLYPVFMNFPATRKYWLAGILLLHLFIALFMGLFFFSVLMLMLNLSAFYAPHYAGKLLSKKEELPAHNIA
jgi:hypothetical protein